jgi:hypothetical protein
VCSPRREAVDQTERLEPLKKIAVAFEEGIVRGPRSPRIQVAAEQHVSLIPRIVKHGAELRERPMHRRIRELVHQPVQRHRS